MVKKQIKKLQAVMSQEEVKKLFSIAESPRDDFILRFLYYTGMRVNEAIHVKKSDINLKENVIRIAPETTKTRREAMQPIPSVFKPFLEQAMLYKQDQDKLIPLTKQRVWQIVKYYVKKAGIKKSIHPHSFRHTYGTHTYEATGDLGKVQELLRHESLASTGIYKHLSKQLKQKAVDDVFK